MNNNQQQSTTTTISSSSSSSRFLCLLLTLAVPAALVATPEKSDDPSTLPTKKILFFTKSSGFEHSVIKDPSKPFKPSPGSEVPGLAFQVLKAIGAKDNIEFVFSKDGSPVSRPTTSPSLTRSFSSRPAT